MRAIFFDMDGTLFKTTSVLETALERTFDMLRAEQLWEGETPLAQYYAIMGVPLPVVWQKLCPNFDEAIRQQCNERFHHYLIEAIVQHEGELYADVHEMLQQLAQKYLLFVTSNGEIAYLQAIVDVFNLQQYFKDVFSIQQIDSLNKGELVKLAMTSYGITEGWVVGDRLSDFQAAKVNGLRSIGVNFDFAQPQELQQADVVADNLLQLLKIIH